MRIAIVAQEYPPFVPKGGLGTQTRAKAHGLADRGFEVHVLTRLPGKGPSRVEDGPVHVARIPEGSRKLVAHTALADQVLHAARAAAAVAELGARKRLDLVDFPEWAAEGFVHLVNRTPWNHVPTTVQIHGPLAMHGPTFGWPPVDSEEFRTGTALEGACLRLADAVYASSACSAAWCARAYGLEAQEIPVLHTGVDLARFDPGTTRKAEHPTVVFAGRIVADKGVLPLVKAAVRLRAEIPELRLRIVGGGEKALVQAIALAAAPAPGLLEMPGYLQGAKLAAALASAHVFAGPSRHEPGPGLVYLEAMAAGLPVVACNSGGAPEVVIPEVSGVLVPPDDEDALAGALRDLLLDPSRRAALAASARAYVRAHHDSGACLDRLAAFLRDVAARNARAGEAVA